MAYNKTSWQDLPNQTTPINATNLNKIEQGIYDATYVNGVNVGTSVDSDYRVNFIKSKNLLNCNNFTSYSGTNINITTSYTDNKLNYINVTKSATTSSNLFISLTEFYFDEQTGTYILNGCPTGGGDGTYTLYLRDNTANTDISPRDTGSGASLNLINNHIYTLYLRINANSTFTNLKFYPMLRKSSLSNSDYEPYVTPTINVDGEEIYNKNIMTYSTDEIRIGTWIDGKPLYRKVFKTTTGNFTNGTSFTLIDHNISNIDIAYINMSSSFIIYTGGSQFVNFNYYLSTTDYARIWLSTTNVRCRIYGDVLKNQTVYITLEYTKATDTATRSLNTIEQTRSIPTESNEDDER